MKPKIKKIRTSVYLTARYIWLRICENICKSYCYVRVDFNVS